MKWFVFAVILVFQVCLFSLTVYKITNSEQSKNIQYAEIAIALLVLFGFITATTYKVVTQSLANVVNNANIEGDYVAGDKIDVSKVSNNFIFHFNAPVEISFHKNKDVQAGSQSGAIESLQIAPNREEYFKYLPNGLKRNNDGIEITNTSIELKRFFNFTKSNFTKTITGKQFKEMNSLLKQILSEEPDFAYAWFYRGLIFSFASINPEFKDKFSSIAESSFKKADDLFNVLLEKHPNDPFLLLYKGMNLTLLNRAEESVSYLKKALSLEPDIFQKKHVLGIIACWNHIAPNYLQEWQTAMEDY